MFIFVKIIDNSLGYVICNISVPVQVFPRSFLANESIDQILLNDPRNPLVARLSNGNMKTVTNLITMISNHLNYNYKNEESNDNSTTLIERQEKNKILREVLIDKIDAMPISDISSVKLFSAALSSSTKSTEELNTNASVKLTIVGSSFRNKIFIILLIRKQ